MEPVSPKQMPGDDADPHRRRIITDKQLQGMCAQALNMAKTDYRVRHRINGVLAVYFEGSGLKRLKSLEAIAEEKGGQAWLNSGHAKDIIFGVLCGGAAEIPPDAIVISTAIDQYEQTPAFDALPFEEQKTVTQSAHPRDLPQYFFQPRDALMAVAQTPARACICTQKFEHGLLIGQPEFHFFDQAKFTGRLKMFGVEPPDRVREAIDELKRRGGGLQ